MHPSSRPRRARTGVPLLALLAATLAALVAFGGSPAAAELPRDPDDQLPRDLRTIDFLNVAHQARDDELDDPAPPNSLAAIEQAIVNGADVVEIDVHLTSDDELVIIHDATVDAATNGTGNVRDMTLAELKALELDAGSWTGPVQRIPTLGEVLDLARGRIGVLIETKTDFTGTELEPAVAAEIQAQPDWEDWAFETLLVGSYDFGSLLRMQAALPGIETAWIRNLICTGPGDVIVFSSPALDVETGLTAGSSTLTDLISVLTTNDVGTVGIFRFDVDDPGNGSTCNQNTFVADDIVPFADAGVIFAQNADNTTELQEILDRGVPGILNEMPSVVAETLPVPPAPTAPTLASGTRQVTVSWTPVDDTNGSRLVGYEVELSTGQTAAAGPTDTEVLVEHVPAGVATSAVVRAVSFAGPSDDSPASAEVIAGAFSDVSAAHPFVEEIGWLADEGITTGYDDGTFKPSAKVTRQAMAAFLHRLAGSPDVELPAQPAFSDVPFSHPFGDEIHWLADEGITDGYDDGTFRPSGNITRQAVAAFLFRLPEA